MTTADVAAAPRFAVVGIHCRDSGAGVPGRLNAFVKGEAGLESCVALSTRGGLEVYAAVDDAGLARIKTVLDRLAGRNPSRFLNAYHGQDAARHLMRMAAGLDGRGGGESVALGRVMAAYAEACAEKTAGRVERLAFQRAFCVAQRLHLQLPMTGAVNSIGGAAAFLARRIFTDIARKKVLVLGAGALAESVAGHLAAGGAEVLWTAKGLAGLGQTDIVIASCAAEGRLLEVAPLRAAVARRGGRPLFVIDGTKPCSVAPAAAEVPDVYLYDLADLRRIASERRARRRDDRAWAEAIVAAEAAWFWMTLAARP